MAATGLRTLWRTGRVLPGIGRQNFASLAVEEAQEAAALGDASTSAQPGSYEPDIVQALPRERSGSISAAKTRKLGRIPSVLTGFPGNKHKLLSLQKNEINKYIRQYRPSGVCSRLFLLEVTEEDGSKTRYPAIAKAIHKTATNDELENVAWMHAPMGKIVDVDVPIRVFGEDISPGVKRGGFVRYVRWTIRCRCMVPQIPSCIPLDVSGLGLGSKVFIEDIAAQLQELGVYIREKHVGDPIIMMSESGSD